MVAATVPTTVTDSVRIQLPKNATAQAALAGLGKLGDIARYEKVRQGRVLDVVFYDMRTAKLAFDTLGPSSCSYLTQSKLARTVQLPGSLHVEMGDLPGVASVKASKSGDGSFLMDFQDSRVAKRYQDKVDKVDKAEPAKKTFLSLPPGLAPPPGLELEGPGYEKVEKNDDAASCASTTFTSAQTTTVDDLPPSPSTDNPQVKLRGLPAAMLSHCTLTAMLQQAGLETSIKNVSISKAEKSKEVVTIELADAASAQHCVTHFNGRRWGASTVSAEVVGAAAAAAAAPKPARAKEMKNMSAEAAEFKPSFSAQAAEFVPSFKMSAMSAEAPAFNPNAAAFVPTAAAASAGLAVTTKGRRMQKKVATAQSELASSSSTEIDSGSECDSQDMSPMYIK